MARHIVLVGLLVVTAACAQKGTRINVASKKVVYATVYLFRVGQQCVIRTLPATLEVAKREEVIWSTLDSCNVDPVDITITFTQTDPCETGERRGKKVRCKIKGDAQGSHKYSVSADGARTEDPELEIAM